MSTANILKDFSDLAVDVTVELGRTRMTIRDLSSLEVGKVVELNRSAKKPLDLLANGKIFARGDLVMVGDNNDRLGLRITELIGMPTEEEG